MSILILNSTKTCPTCGCETVVREQIKTTQWPVRPEREISVHCNSKRWEEREFLCGYVSEYVPNFLRCEGTRPCQHNAEYREKYAKQRALKLQIRELEDQLRAMGC